ncbi:MAG: hypothetical protein Q9159_006182 [Coniocarpon cinnabarinum]
MHGHTNTDADIRDQVKLISDACKHVKESLSADENSSQSPATATLQTQVERCLDDAARIEGRLKDVQVISGSRRYMVSGSLKSLNQRKPLKDMLKRLKHQRDTLTMMYLTQIGTDTRSSLLNGTRMLGQLNQLQLHSTVSQRTYTDRLQQQQELLSREQQRTKQILSDVDDEIKHSNRQYVDERQRDHVLRSLSFANMRQRQLDIHERYLSTYDLALNSLKPLTCGDSLVEWLQNDQDLYWIQGKPGAGKSTLLNFVVHDDRTRQYLRQWSADHKLICPSFYFWKPGTEKQKSYVGAMRALVHQIFLEDPALMATTLASLKTDFAGWMTGDVPDWTEKTLRHALRTLTTQSIDSAYFCFFLDGLDECDTFANVPGLRLQDLTRTDVQTYVDCKLRQHPRWQGFEDEDPVNSEALIQLIISQAEGVFLWVELVVKDIIHGFRNRDSLFELRNRVQSSSREMDELYAQLVDRIDKNYLKSTAKCLNLVLASHKKELSLMDLLISLKEPGDNQVDFAQQLGKAYKEIEPKMRIDQCFNDMRRYLNARCDCFLTIEPTQYPRVAYLHDERDDVRFAKERINLNDSNDDNALTHAPHDYVRLLHRTAQDFLLNSDKGRMFLKEYTDASFSAPAALIKGLLRHVELIAIAKPSASHLDFKHVHRIFCMAAANEQQTHRHNTQLMNQVLKGLQDAAKMLKGTLPQVFGPTTKSAISWVHRFNLNCWQTCPCNRSLLCKRYEDFVKDELGICAALGLRHYVVSQVRCPNQFQHEEYLTYLLFCTNLGPHMCAWIGEEHGTGDVFGRKESIMGAIQLGTQLLEIGAKPMRQYRILRPRLEVLSSWSLFLDRLLRNSFINASQLKTPSDGRPTRMNVQKLLEHYMSTNADLNEGLYIRRCAPGTLDSFICHVNAIRAIDLVYFTRRMGLAKPDETYPFYHPKPRLPRRLRRQLIAKMQSSSTIAIDHIIGFSKDFGVIEEERLTWPCLGRVSQTMPYETLLVERTRPTSFEELSTRQSTFISASLLLASELSWMNPSGFDKNDRDHTEMCRRYKTICYESDNLDPFAGTDIFHEGTEYLSEPLILTHSVRYEDCERESRSRGPFQNRQLLEGPARFMQTQLAGCAKMNMMSHYFSFHVFERPARLLQLEALLHC